MRHSGCCTKPPMSAPNHEDLLRRLFVCSHVTTTALRAAEHFDEWTAMKVFALRAFQRVPNYALGATELARSLRCSVPYASKLMKRMHAEGLLQEGTAWRSFRAMVLTPDGEARLTSDAECLESFARQACRDISDEERLTLFLLLGRITANVRA